MSRTEPTINVGEWRVDPASHSISSRDRSVRLSPKAMQVLMLLHEHRGQVISREQILETVWPGRVVVEESVTQAISELRKALQDDRKSPRHIETIPKAGYRLISSTEPLRNDSPDFDAGSASVAVLPFIDLSEAGDQAYFCDGMADELIGALFQVPGLKVSSRTASFAYRTSTTDLREIASHLGVAYLVEGSVRRHGDALRVAVRLIEMPRGYQRWSETFDRRREDVFTVQDEIARRVVKSLQNDVPVFRNRERPDIRAYDYYLRGRQYFYRGGAVAGRLGQQMFQRAIEIDPDYALAHAGLADSQAFGWLYYYEDPDLLAAALGSATRAIELAPQLAEAHSALGNVLSASNNYTGAKPAFERAIELSPDLFEPRYLYGRASLVAAEYERAARSLRRALEIRPESIQVYTILARAYHALGDHDKEITAYARALELVKHQLKLLPNDTRSLCVAAACHAALGSRDRAREYALQANQSDDPMSYYAACALARAGFEDEALDSLETAYQIGWNHLAWLENDPELDRLRDSPRFLVVQKALAKRIQGE